MGKIIIGIIMVVGGLSGQLVFIGTQSRVALGTILIVWGIMKLVRARKGS